MWKRHKKLNPTDPETANALAQSQQARAEVQALKIPVNARHHRLLKLGVVLDGIREENHFSHKIFGDL